jgi:hypothetical protein
MFVVESGVVRLQIQWKGQMMESLIDLCDLEFAKSINGRWFAQLDKRSNKFYIYASKGRRGKLFFHRAIMGAPESAEVDHINRNTLDNRRLNLRVVSREGNRQNLGESFSNNKSSGIRGVHWHKGDKKWQVTVGAFGKKYYIGKFKNLSDAENAARNARQELQPFSREARLAVGK